MVVMVKVAVVAPAATVTLAGTVVLLLLSDNVTTDPPLGAGPFRVTVPVEELPPVTVAGFRLTEASAGGLTVSVAVLVPFEVAVIVTVCCVLTAAVVMVKAALVAPAGTVTLGGTATEALLSERPTTTPPVAAAALRVTVPVDEAPPVTDVGFTLTESSVGGGGLTVSVAVWFTPL